MSNALAIAATTATLRALLIEKLGIPGVTARAPDKARDPNMTGDQVNLFLYQAAPSAAWRNADMPRQVKPGETGHPPLPLTLSYLLTAYSGEEKDDVTSQILLGRAMSVMHDHPLLDKTEIKNATDSEVLGSDLHEQIERVRITLEPLPLEELSKLWAAFQTHYRTSAAYKADVVLIESTRPAKAPMPVLTRGEDDTGIASKPDVESPFPALLAIHPPAGQASARLGDVVTITGQHLDAGTLEVHMNNPRLPDPGPVTILPDASATEVKIELTDDPTLWVAGLYTVAVVLTSGKDVRTTNELPLTIAPLITSTPLPLSVQRKKNPGQPDDESAEIKLTFKPQFRLGQRATLLIGDREVPAEPPPPPTPPQTGTNMLTFIVKKAPVGMHFLRLRIDGVDSLLILPGPPPTFDPNQMVNIHD
jgi:hypothetical protein